MILAAARNTERRRPLIQAAIVAVFFSLRPAPSPGQVVGAQPATSARWAVVVQSGYTPASSAGDGVGLMALAGGRSVDLLTPDTWRSGPGAACSDNTEIGVGWKRQRVSAVLGYVRQNANSEPSVFNTEGAGSRFKSRSMMGVGLALHY